MLLSIIIPVFNVQKYLAQCIDSVLNQDYKNLEIILVNDGSTDNSLQICNDYALIDNRISVINQENGGLSAARNSGLKIATGNYIFFLDSDDWIEENTISKLILELKNETIEILEFSLRMFIEKTQAFEESIHNQSKINVTNGVNYILENKRMSPQACVYLYKKSFLDENNFRFKENLIHEDEHFNWNCFLKVQKIKKSLILVYNYRIRENSITMGKITAQKLDSHLFILEFLANLKKSNFFEVIYIENRITKYLNQLIHLLINSDLNFNKKLEFLNQSKQKIQKRQIFDSDSKILKFEKKIFNFNTLSLYLYFILRKIR